ncbi:hypothetical protein PG993_000748, partial [Apiospora rasikravindrae]
MSIPHGGGGVVEIYTHQPPEALLQLLSAHLPHSLSLLRRLQFTKFPGGITEHARILYASNAPLPSPPNGTGVAATAERDDQHHHRHHPFTAAFLDISRGPETQMWMYSTLERCGSNGDENKRGVEEEERKAALGHAVSLLHAARRIRDHSPSSPLGPCVLAGTLSEVLRTALRDEAGIASSHVSLYDKWLLDVRELPLVNGQEPLLEPGMRWGTENSQVTAQHRDHAGGWHPHFLVFPRYVNNLSLNVGPDASLSSLHCEEPYRGRGFAKAVAAKLIKDRLKDYGGDDSTLCCAEVAADNPSSQGVCKSLGGKIGWTVC